MGDYQCISYLAVIRYVGLALTGFCLWRQTLVSGEWIDTRDKFAPLSFRRISRALRRGVMHGVFQKSAQDANFRNSQILPAELLKMIV